MTTKANPIEITVLVTKSKATRIEKLIKINEINVAKLAQPKKSRQVLETALTGSFEDEYFPNFEKGK